MFSKGFLAGQKRLVGFAGFDTRQTSVKKFGVLFVCDLFCSLCFLIQGWKFWAAPGAPSTKANPSVTCSCSPDPGVLFLQNSQCWDHLITNNSSRAKLCSFLTPGAQPGFSARLFGCKPFCPSQFLCFPLRAPLATHI